MDEKWRSTAHNKIKNIAVSVARGLECECEVDIKKGYPSLYNDPLLTKKIREYAVDLLGPENVLDADIWMASEDFAYYSQRFSSCFYMLGVGFKGRNHNYSLHTSTLEVDEKSLETGISLMSYIGIKHLQDDLTDV
jgi:metal-dependent amidase/aminoacylase/carboxypeptidase family protein